MKRWTVSRPDEAAVKRINAGTDLGPLLSEVMAARKYEDLESLAEFFNGDELSDPFLLADMQNAVEAINQAVDSGELICVYGDYDCDGITSTAVLAGYLESMGAEVICKIPERDEGYGLNPAAVEEMRDLGVSLIITVDNGVTAIEEAKLIAELGLKLVITDHHRPTDILPEALAIVDPHRKDCPSPFKELCGAGVVLKLCAALDGGSYDMVCEQYLDLVAVATIADVMPLIGENRIIVSRGLRLLKNTENLGMAALAEKSGLSLENITASGAAFGLVPRINAASRFGSPQTALNMLLSDGPEAENFAEELDRLNSKRKTVEAAVFSEINEIIDKDPAALNGRILTVAGKNWHRGIIGIVAAKLMEAYEKPALVISIGDDGFACGSARSFEGFNVFACFDSCRELLIKYGGHELAGGLTVSEENIPALKDAIEKYARENVPVMPKMTLSADKLLRGSDITFENAASLSKIEPFGRLNPEPMFAISGAEIAAVHPIKNGEYTKLDLVYDGVRASAIMFRVKTADFPLSAGDKIDLMANMSPNEYKGIRSVSLRVADYRLHGAKQEPFFAARSAYEAFIRREDIDKEILKKGDPQRAELVEVYKFITSSKTPITYESLYARLGGRINAFKLQIILDAFCDVGLIGLSRQTGRITPKTPTSRADLDSSETLIGLRRLI